MSLHCEVIRWSHGIAIGEEIGNHDWRLHERIEVRSPTQRLSGWAETWYCIRCRHVEERLVDREKNQARC